MIIDNSWLSKHVSLIFKMKKASRLTNNFALSFFSENFVLITQWNVLAFAFPVPSNFIRNLQKVSSFVFQSTQQLCVENCYVYIKQTDSEWKLKGKEVGEVEVFPFLRSDTEREREKAEVS